MSHNRKVFFKVHVEKQHHHVSAVEDDEQQSAMTTLQTFGEMKSCLWDERESPDSVLGGAHRGHYNKMNTNTTSVPTDLPR